MTETEAQTRLLAIWPRQAPPYYLSSDGTAHDWDEPMPPEYDDPDDDAPAYTYREWAVDMAGGGPGLVDWLELMWRCHGGGDLPRPAAPAPTTIEEFTPARWQRCTHCSNTADQAATLGGHPLCGDCADDEE